MSYRAIIIDNFYADPDAVRELASNCPYVPKGQLSQNFAGEESMEAYFTSALVKKLEQAVNSRIIVDPQRNAFGRFRLAKSADKRRTKVHSDNTDWTAVVYLTPDDSCQGGTQFFKHIPTGLESPPTEEDLKLLGMTREEFDVNVVLRDSLDPSKWEVTEEVSMKYNRCALIKGKQYFHGSSHLFGDEFKNARLTQNFFFNVVAND